MKDFFSPLTSFISKKLQRHEMKKKGLVQSKKKRRLKHEEGSLATAAEKSKTLGILILFAVWGICVAVLLAMPQRPIELNFIAGHKAQETEYAEISFKYEDENLTKEKRLEARKNQPLVYRLNYQSCKDSLDAVNKISETILLSENNTPLNLDGFQESEKAFNSLSPGLKSAMLLILKNPDSKDQLIKLLEASLYHGIFSQKQREELQFDQKLQIYKGEVKEKRRSGTSVPTPSEIAEEVASETMSSASPENRNTLKKVLTTILSEVVSPNLVYDEMQTEINREQAEKKISPVMVEIKKDDILIQKGHVVDRETQAKCRAYLAAKREKQSGSALRIKFLNSASLCLLMIVISGIYISHVHPEIIESNQKMGLIATVVSIAVVINYAAIELFNPFITAFDLHPQLLPIAIPIALGSIILTALIGLRVAFFTGLFVSIIAAMQLNNSFEIVISGMVICGIAAFAGRHRLNYKSYFLASWGAITLTMPVMMVINIWSSPNFLDLLPYILLFGAVNGLFTTALSLFIIFILEWIFQVTSDMTLLLLCDYNHPLLKKLQMEAPGTYHHSLVVSTLAEHAAQAIGANPIRARVIALFHDIGKMVKPEYFTENQQTDENKHTKLNPNMSSLVIINHTKEGIDLALKHKLRKIIRDGIEQHHGTDTVYYFYQQALEEARKKGQPVDEHEFKYPGPKPKEKEVVILSLADPCEAASRTIQKPTPAKIDALVWEIFRKRIRDGQLDNANITFGDLKKIRESFTSTLSTMMHGRISYPKDTEDDDEGDLFVATQKKNGNGKKA